MDVIGTISDGLDTLFLDNEHYGIVSGNGLCIYHINRGPKEFYWYPHGISALACHSKSSLLAIAGYSSVQKIELIDSITHSVKGPILSNRTNTRVISLSFSISGDRLVGLTDYSNQHVLGWLVNHEVPLFSLQLSTYIIPRNLPLYETNQSAILAKSISYNPCDINSFCLKDGKSLIIGKVDEILDEHIVSLNYLDVFNGYITTKENDPLVYMNQLKLLVWFPSNIMLICDNTNTIYAVNISTKVIYNLGIITHPSLSSAQFVPTSALVTSSHLLLSSNVGDIIWYDIDFLKIIKLSIDPLVEHYLKLESIVQILKLDTPIKFMLIDVYDYAGIAGTNDCTLIEFPTPVLVSNTNHDAEDVNNNITNPVVDHQAAIPELPQSTLTKLKESSNEGIITSCSVAIPMTKSDSDESLLHCFITSTHNGTLLIWRIPIIEDDQQLLGKKINPETFHKIKEINIRDHANKPENAIIPIVTSISFYGNAPGKKSQMILGYSDGFIGIVRLVVQEFDDDEIKLQAQNSGIFEDDGILVQLEAVMLFSIRLYISAINYICVDPSGTLIGCLSNNSDDVYILKYNSSTKYTVVKRLIYDKKEVNDNSSTKMISLFWGNASSYISVLLSNGLILFYQNRFDNSDSIVASPDSVLNLNIANIGGYLSITPSLLLNYNLTTTNVQLYSLPQDIDVMMRSQLNLEAKQSHTLTSHIYASQLVLSYNKKYVACGTIDGYVTIYAITSIKRLNDGTEDPNFLLLDQQRLHNSTVISISFSLDSSLVLTTAIDGSTFIIKIADAITKYNETLLADLSAAGQESRLIPITESVSNTWLHKYQKVETKNLIQKYSDNVEELVKSIDSIHYQIQALIDNNNVREPIEQLDRKDFIVDEISNNYFNNEINSNINELKDSYNKMILINELIAARIRHQCYDSQEYNSLSIYPLNANQLGNSINSPSNINAANTTANPVAITTHTPINSYSIRRWSTEEAITLDRIKRLRRIEIKSQSAHEFGCIQKINKKTNRILWSTTIQGVSKDVTWIEHDGINWPTHDILVNPSDVLTNTLNSTSITDDKQLQANKATAEDDDISVSSNEDTELDIKNLTVFDLLYTPFAIRTQIQKRIQIYLLKEVDREIRKSFNIKFDELKNYKEDVLDSLQSRNLRLNEINKEMAIDEKFITPTLLPDEIEGTCLFVDDSEINVEKYETEEEKAQRSTIEAEKKRLIDEGNYLGSNERALYDMMNGTLEVKRNIFETLAIEKPDWMNDLAPSDMNEFQLKEFEEYEAKVKAFNEENLKYRKSLEQESKKLKLENNELFKAFDEKFQSLFSYKLKVNQKILYHEIYSSRIAYSIVARDQLWGQLLSNKETLSRSISNTNPLSNRIKALKNKLEDISVKINISKEEEMQLDRTFRRDLQDKVVENIAPETLIIMTQLYKKRYLPTFAEDDILHSMEGSDGGKSDDESNSRLSGTGSKTSKDRRSKSKRSKKNSRGSRGSAQAQTRNSKDNNANTINRSHSRVQNRTKRVSKSNLSSSDVKDVGLGPMQEAARALRAQPDSKEDITDPYQISILYKNKVKRMNTIPIPVNESLKQENDSPEGFIVSQFVWSKLMELRSIRVEKEIITKSLLNEYAVLKQQLENCKQEEQIYDQYINDVKIKKKEYQRLINDYDNNLDILVKLLQGQDECYDIYYKDQIDKKLDKKADDKVDSTVIDEYKNAILIPIQVLNIYNNNILQLGNDKISILNKIKLFRRKINYVEWEANHLTLLRKHLDEYFTDLQLLRVTKQLQQVIRNDINNTNVNINKIDQLNNRKEYIYNNNNKKLNTLRELKESILNNIQNKSIETTELNKQINLLTNQVQLHSNIKTNRENARKQLVNETTVLDNNTLRMKKITTRRQLVDSIKAQAEEIDYLKQELDKLRQKTFPSFIRHNKTIV